MNKKGKVLNLFDHKNIIPQNEDVKYSVLLSDLMDVFKNEFPEDFYMEDAVELCMNAWNLANMSFIVPENEFKEILSNSPSNGFESKLLNKIILRKISHFNKYDRFIAEFEIKEVKGEPILSVLTEEKESFLANLLNEIDEEYLEEDFEAGYINRQAIVLTLQQPFIDWAKEYTMFLEEEDAQQSKIYLVNDEFDDLEKWLKKNFDKFFTMELEEWHDNKKNWPQRRTYKMFNQWFQVNLSSEIFDMEEMPITKE
jgi:hypothetical protein